jgi:hypothetical protein
MIDASMIPDEVVDACEQAMLDAWERGECTAKVFARAAITAALNAWPGADIEPFGWASKPDILMLPLTTGAASAAQEGE